MGKSDNSPDSPRKSPQQSRSIALVEAIMGATVRILPKAGWRGITTKKVAEVAGVSIGSLYQYFPNKESLLKAVIDFAMKAQHDRFERHLSDHAEVPIEAAVDSVIELALDLFLGDLEQTRAIYKGVPELGKMPALIEMRRLTSRRLAEELRTRLPQVSERKANLIAFVGVNAVMGVVQAAIYDEETQFSRAELEKELKRLVASFIERAPCAGTAP